MNIEPRPLKKDEFAIVPYDNNIFVVIRLDSDNTKKRGEQRYKVQEWNKEFNSYGNSVYDLTYFNAKKTLAKKIDW